MLVKFEFIKNQLLVVIALLLLLGSASPAAAANVFNAAADSEVDSIAVQTDGQILIGGGFTNVNNTPRNGIARLNIDGTLDESFNFDTLVCIVNGLALQADGKILIGGSFATSGTYIQGKLGRLNSDGSLDAGFSIPTLTGSFVTGVNVVVLQPDGKILVGGTFNTVDGVTHNAIVRLNSDGNLDTTFTDSGALGTYMGLAVFSIAVQSDGKILIGGNFHTTDGALRNYIARLNANGTLDTTFDSMADSYAHAIYVQPDGKIVVGTDILNAGGLYARIGCARLNSDGSLDSSFVFPNLLNGGGYVYSIARQTDGKFLIGGAFDNIGGTSRYSIARLNSNGSFDATFTATTEDNNSVNSVALQADGKVLIGGTFSKVNGVTHDSIARLEATGSLDTTPTAIAAPLAAAATSIGSTGFTANWYPVYGATGYRIDVATDSAFSNLLAAYSNRDTGNVISFAVTGLTPVTPYYYRLRAHDSADTSGNSNPVAVTTLQPASEYALNITINGTGLGRVTSTPPGIDCTSGNTSGCSYSFTSGTSVSLTPYPLNGSEFGHWAVDCTGSGSCTVPMSAQKSVTATFNVLPYATIYGTTTMYAFLRDAYDAASDGSIIEARGIVFPEDLTMDATNKNVTIKGGYDDATFTTRGGITSLQGVLTVESGSLTVDLLAVK